MVSQRKVHLRIVQYIPDLNGTTTTFIRKQIALIAEENEVLVITNTQVYDRFKLEGIKYRSIPLPFLSSSRLIRKIKWVMYSRNLKLNFYNRAFSKELNRELAVFYPQLIHCQFGDNGLVFWENLNSTYRKLPIYIQFRGYDVTQMPKKFSIYWRKLMKVLGEPNVHTLAVSKSLYQYAKSLGFQPKIQRILYSCIDLEKFSRVNHQSNHQVFLQVSSFREKKGHLVTINAFAKFLQSQSEKNKYKLILAGDGEMLNQAKDLALELNIDSQVYFPGAQNHSEAIALMEEADFFVHHSITPSSGDKEGIPNAIIEAMAMEMPILTSYHSGIPEIVENGVNGILVEEGDIDNYAQSMIDILHWNYIPENRKKIEQFFDQKIHKKQLLKFYKELVQ